MFPRPIASGWSIRGIWPMCRPMKSSRLDCAYCHVPDDAAQPATPRSGASVPAAGAYMQPINFERHCAACHSGELVAEMQGAAEPAKQLPHGIPSAAIREILAGLASPLSGPPRVSPSQPLVKIPGRTPGENLAQTTQLDAATRAADAAVRLMGEARCGKCHVHAPVEDNQPSAHRSCAAQLAIGLAAARAVRPRGRTGRCSALSVTTGVAW